MQIQLLNGISSHEHYQLGFQDNPDEIETSMHSKSIYFAPKRAKSYSIFDITHTDYYGRLKSSEVTGYGHFKVKYFTRIAEGDFKIPS